MLFSVVILWAVAEFNPKTLFIKGRWPGKYDGYILLPTIPIPPDLISIYESNAKPSTPTPPPDGVKVLDFPAELPRRPLNPLPTQSSAFHRSSAAARLPPQNIFTWYCACPLFALLVRLERPQYEQACLLFDPGQSETSFPHFPRLPFDQAISNISD